MTIYELPPKLLLKILELLERIEKLEEEKNSEGE